MNGDRTSWQGDRIPSQTNTAQQTHGVDLLRQCYKNGHKDTNHANEVDQEQQMLYKIRKKDREFTKLDLKESQARFEGAGLNEHRLNRAQDLANKLREIDYRRLLTPQEVQDIKDLLNIYQKGLAKPAKTEDM